MTWTYQQPLRICLKSTKRYFPFSVEETLRVFPIWKVQELGIYCSSGNGVGIKNNIVVSNGNYGISCDALPEPAISYNDVWNNIVGDYSGCTAGVGDISCEPEFEDSLNYNFYITSGPCCIDAGTSDDAPAFDFDEKARFDDLDTEDTGSGTYTYYDIGAYEYKPVIVTDPEDDFVITVKTIRPGTSSDYQFTIPTYPGESYNYNVDCDNDGEDEATAQMGDYTCTYASTGEYSIRIKDNTKGYDCAYPALERLPDGTILATTYGHWREGEAPYILSVRIRLEETDLLATKNKNNE